MGRRRFGSPRRRALVVFVLQRLVWLVPVLVGVVLVTFALMHLAPGSPWNLGDESADAGVHLSEAAVRHLDARYGLDEPWWEQLALYVRSVARFDLGDSYRYPGRSVAELIGDSVGPTFTLAAIALVVIVPFGMALGVVAALRHNSPVDWAVTGLATFAASVPNFVVGILLIIIFSVTLNRLTGGAFFLPAAGFGLDQRLVLPLLTLSLFPIAFLARLMRSSTLETLGQDHVRTARAKGLRPRLVVTRHVVKNSLVPVITTLGPMFTFLVSGTIIVEALFQIPGLGGTFVQAVTARDYPVILGAAIVFTLVVVVANLGVDIAYALVDPRVTLS